MKKNDCKHYGTMTIPPIEKEEEWVVYDWCFYQRCGINGECPKDCQHKDKPIQSWE